MTIKQAIKECDKLVAQLEKELEVDWNNLPHIRRQNNLLLDEYANMYKEKRRLTYKMRKIEDEMGISMSKVGKNNGEQNQLIKEMYGTN